MATKRSSSPHQSSSDEESQSKRGRKDKTEEKKSTLSAKVEEWKAECHENSSYLFGEKVKYSFETPRTTSYLRNSSPLQIYKGSDKKCSVGKSHILQGPYHLQDD